MILADNKLKKEGLIKMNIIELQPESSLPISDHIDVYYYEKLFIGEMIKDANSHFQLQGMEERTEAEMLRNWLDQNPTTVTEQELVQSLKEWYIDEDDWEYFETLEDFMEDDPEFYLNRIFEEDRESLASFFDANDLQFGTVGYSPWSYYLTAKDTDKSFVRDLYEGWNFYHIISLDSDGEVDGNAYNIYLGDKEYTIEDAVKDYFGYDDFYLVDNEYSQYFNHKKVKKIPHTTYTFDKIEE